MILHKQCDPHIRQEAIDFLVITIPFAEAITMAEFTGVPAACSALRYCWTSLSISPKVSGWPHFKDERAETSV